MIGVLIAENDPMAKALIELFVGQSETYQVAASICCHELTPELLQEHPVQLALMNTDGMEGIGWLRQNCPGVKIIAMTSMPDYSYLTGAKERGADSFWYQQPDEKALLEIMDRTMAGDCVYPQQKVVRFGQALSTDYTDRELQVLREVVAGSTDAEIGEKLGISLRTVKGHIQNLREKSGYRNRTELAVHARSSGLIIR